MSRSKAHAPSPATLAENLKEEAYRLGFSFAKIAPPTPPSHADSLEPWLTAGKHGSMSWLERDPERRSDPRILWPSTRSILSVGMNYHQSLPHELLNDPSRGRFAVYAWGFDYHDLLLERLQKLGESASRIAGSDVAFKPYVDTGALLERPIASDAGAGFIGKHTLLINRGLGSHFFLGELLLDLDLPPDNASGVTFGCGTCHRCGDACPTNALSTPWSVDARRCLSYLTIELKGPIPREFRSAVGNRIFGCDICQDTCPYNARMLETTEEEFFLATNPERIIPTLLDLLALDDDKFRSRFRGTAVIRSKRRSLLRNVTVALGNWGSDEAISPLINVLGDHEPLIRGHAAWALGKIDRGTAREALRTAHDREEDDYVREEIELALDGALDA